MLFAGLDWTVAAPAQTGKPPEWSTLEGQVRNSVTGEPVARASLVLMRVAGGESRDEWRRSYGVISGGQFAIRDIEPGRYRLRVTRNGFVALDLGARPRETMGAVIDLENPRTWTDVDVRLTPHGVVAGRILDAEGEPLAGAQVQLLAAGRY